MLAVGPLRIDEQAEAILEAQLGERGVPELMRSPLTINGLWALQFGVLPGSPWVVEGCVLPVQVVD